MVGACTCSAQEALWEDPESEATLPRKKNKKQNKKSGASKLVQQVKALPAKTNNLSLIPGTPRVEGENQLPRVAL